MYPDHRIADLACWYPGDVPGANTGLVDGIMIPAVRLMQPWAMHWRLNLSRQTL